MKTKVFSLLSLLLCLTLLLSLAPAALAEEGESIIDEDKLNAWIKEYVAAHDLSGGGQDFSVGFCYTATGDCWYYNGDVFMYSASMYKVPVSMLLAEKEAAGELSQDSYLGGQKLRDLEYKALVKSDNPSGHGMLAYLGRDDSGKASELCMQYSSLSREYFHQDFFDYSYYSARFITQVMRTLCEGGEERFPHIIEYLLQAEPDEYMNLKLKGKYQVAQKYGAFEERNGNYNNHITAIIYTPTPIVVTVMTRNVGNFQPRMAEVGEYLANYALELDEKYPEWEARQAAAREAEQQPQEPALSPELSGESAQGNTEEPAAQAASAPIAAMPEREADPGSLTPAFILLWAAIAAFAGLILYHWWKVRRPRARVSDRQDRADLFLDRIARRSKSTASRGRH